MHAIEIAVRLSPDEPRQHHVYAEADAAQVVLVLVHGSTLSHVYWDPGYRADHYSFVDRAVGAGYAVVNLDRIGVGRSSRPPGQDVTLSSNAYVLHQVVEQIRTGVLTEVRPAAVVLVGHSFGSAVSVTEAGTWADVDAVVATGFLHEASPSGAYDLLSVQIPVDDDPVFANQGYPDGYVTTRAGTRGQFFEPELTEPELLALDETGKGTGTTGESQSFVEYFDPDGPASRIRVPVLLAIGQRDHYFSAPDLPCDTAEQVLAREAPFFTRSRCLSGYVLPAAGHNISWQRNAPELHTELLRWIGDHLRAESHCG